VCADDYAKKARNSTPQPECASSCRCDIPNFDFGNEPQAESSASANFSVTASTAGSLPFFCSAELAADSFFPPAALAKLNAGRTVALTLDERRGEEGVGGVEVMLGVAEGLGEAATASIEAGGGPRC